ncbi:MAG: hypothetical protein JWP59_1883 [Massilia sp.]|nr:hypothetical protein [Massilia sp.]
MMRTLGWMLVTAACSGTVLANDAPAPAAQAGDAHNANPGNNIQGKGFGPQAPRDLGSKIGVNKRVFAFAPPYQEMNLCNIHFHKNAEHKGGEFTAPASDAGGHEAQAGYRYARALSAAETRPLAEEVCKGEHGGLQAGDTVELHYVHSSADVAPGHTLGACLSESDSNPQLRVEAQVFVLVNDPRAADFKRYVKTGEVGGYWQALQIPRNAGTPIRYAGSTTGPAYNEKASPLQVSWSVRPKVLKVNAQSVGQWCQANVFKEDHPHAARKLVVDPRLLSPIK